MTQKKLLIDVGREAQSKVRNLIESVDNFESAKNCSSRRA